jgi:hypothetical protein
MGDGKAKLVRVDALNKEKLEDVGARTCFSCHLNRVPASGNGSKKVDWAWSVLRICDGAAGGARHAINVCTVVAARKHEGHGVAIDRNAKVWRPCTSPDRVRGASRSEAQLYVCSLGQSIEDTTWQAEGQAVPCATVVQLHRRQGRTTQWGNQVCSGRSGKWSRVFAIGCSLLCAEDRIGCRDDARKGLSDDPDLRLPLFADNPGALNLRLCLVELKNGGGESRF